jgi:PAP2 superfamily protein
MSRRRYRSKPRGRLARVLAIVRAEPTAIHYLAAAAIYGLTPLIMVWLQNMALPHDAMFGAAVYLMSGGRSDTAHPEPPLITIASWINFAAAAVLIASAATPPARRYLRLHAAASRFYKYALALPAWTLLVATLDRFIANEVHSLAGLALYDLTRVLSKIEGPLIAGVQTAAGSQKLAAFVASAQPLLLLAPIAFAGALLVAADRSRVLNSLIVAYLFAGLLAVPLFVLLPTFEPWTTNAAYGAKVLATNIRFLYANASRSTLTRINSEYHWAAGGAFPSLHIAVLLVGAFVLRRFKFVVSSLVLFGLAAITAITGVYLGRHWVVDSVAAIPFALAVVALAARFPLDLSLRQRREVGPVFRPGQIAVVDPNEQSPNWLFSGFYRRWFKAFSRDTWQVVRLAPRRIRASSMRLLSFRSNRRGRRPRLHRE